MNAIAFPNEDDLRKFEKLSIVVTSPETELQARNYLTDVRLAGKRLDQDIKVLKRPHQDAVKAIDDAARPWKTMLTERDQKLEQALLAYGRQVRLAAEEAQRKLNEKYEKKVEKQEAKAVAEGRPMPIVLPPPIVATPPKSVGLDGAKQTTVKRKAWRLPASGAFHGEPDTLDAQTNESFKLGIPAQYFILDTARIGKVVRAGGTIPGIEVYEEESIAVRA